jgi:hypothetical protein
MRGIELKQHVYQNGSLNVAESWNSIVQSDYDLNDLTLYLTCVSLRLNSSTIGLIKPVLFPVTDRRNSASGKSDSNLPTEQYKNSEKLALELCLRPVGAEYVQRGAIRRS